MNEFKFEVTISVLIHTSPKNKQSDRTIKAGGEGDFLSTPHPAPQAFITKSFSSRIRITVSEGIASVWYYEKKKAA